MAIVDFFFHQHEPGLIVLAAVVCLISAYTCMGLLRHAKRAADKKRPIWIAIAALTVGFGIWTTHFVAMVAFKPGFEIVYDIALTLISLLIAIVVCGAGIYVTTRGNTRWDHALGGAVVGLAISVMHYTGISASLMEGSLLWDHQLVGLSILAGLVLSAVAFVVASSGGSLSVPLGAIVLTLAICAVHFTGMAAADFSLCGPVEGAGELDGFMLSLIIALISAVLVGVAVASMVLENAHFRRVARENEREQRDANRIGEVSKTLHLAMTNMAQGLGFFDAKGALQLYNERLKEMLMIDPRYDLTGADLRELCRLSLVSNNEPEENIEARVETFHAEHSRLVKEGGQIEHQLGAGRVLRVSHSPVGDGSWVSTIDDVTERYNSERAIAHMARHDVLTGLPNRSRFDEQFEAMMATADEKKTKLAVVAIDLDRFKEVNDIHGHAAGDMVLEQLAKRLNDVLRDGEVVARIGGDEFSALKLFSTMEGLREFLGRLDGALHTRIEADDLNLSTGASIGVAIYPDDGEDRSKLLSNADLAMYRAKGEFDHHICYYEREMDELARERREMGRDIWTALETNGFYLAYQVQKSVLTGDVTGYEVLLRWVRPGYGQVAPADFIPVAEECGAINGIGAWVLRAACADAAAWPQPHKIAVNVSAIQLGSFDLIDTVKQVLDDTGLDPKRLELEVTETAIIADKSRALHILTAIRAMGVSIAIDDFGTGYSSLDTLRSFPFDKIKLDRSFMNEVEQNEQSKAIVRAILALGRSLSVPVLAEGVETPAQLEVLRLEGCNEAQGFFLGRPGFIAWEDAVGTAAQ
ncbi:EAL domain-containing protein [Devosia sp. MC1541]|uniref:EAL domain-containing protein n=1 Tax=Devosia sp. MC1541 TaxID=2725264 RepID=UPI00145EAE40|nr:EAL domain-containing protein [Devosia sp. MC1541]